MKTRVITAIVIIAVVAYPLIAGGWALNLLAFFVISSGLYEWLRKGEGYDKWGLPITIIGILYIFAARWLLPMAPFAYLATGAILVWSLPIFWECFTVADSWMCVSAVMFFTLVWLCFGPIDGAPQYLWTICLATYGSDTGAYFVGRSMGRHKMNPRISPKKSWEGFAGGLISGFLLSWLLSLFYAGSLDSTVNLLLCLLCPAMAELGDLCFSAIKRSRHQKDFSNLLPGHGGVLDRVDSLLYNIILFGIILSILP